MHAGLMVEQFIPYVARPVLRYLDPAIPYSLAAEQLCVLTILHESGGLQYLDQLSSGPGPAYGVGQMEGPTYKSHMHWIATQPPPNAPDLKVWNVELLPCFNAIRSEWLDGPEELWGNLSLSVAMVRLHYRRKPEAVPAVGDWQAMAELAKHRYNTAAGKATPADYYNASKPAQFYYLTTQV